MKKLLFIAAISLGLVASTSAQENGFGARAGLNIASATGDDVGDVDGLMGFHVGGFATVMIGDAFAVQPELLYSTKGAEDLTFSYIDIPVLAKYYFTENISALAGPQIGLLMSADNDGTDVKDAYKSMDLAFAIGGEYALDMGLSFGVRYTSSLGSVAEDFEFAGTTTEFDVKNSVVQIALGYKF